MDPLRRVPADEHLAQDGALPSLTRFLAQDEARAGIEERRARRHSFRSLAEGEEVGLMDLLAGQDPDQPPRDILHHLIFRRRALALEGLGQEKLIRLLARGGCLALHQGFAEPARGALQLLEARGTLTGEALQPVVRGGREGKHLLQLRGRQVEVAESLQQQHVFPLLRGKLEAYERALGLEKDSFETRELRRLASLSRGELPPTVLADKQLAGKLPALFRTLEGDRVDDALLDERSFRIHFDLRRRTLDCASRAGTRRPRVEKHRQQQYKRSNSG
jgi:hypothetical protein